GRIDRLAIDQCIVACRRHGILHPKSGKGEAAEIHDRAHQDDEDHREDGKFDGDHALRVAQETASRRSHRTSLTTSAPPPPPVEPPVATQAERRLAPPDSGIASAMICRQSPGPLAAEAPPDMVTGPLGK